MRSKLLLVLLIAILAACERPTATLTPSPSNPAQTATQAPSATTTQKAATAAFTPAPTPTQEISAFNIYRIAGTSNIRDGASLNAPIVGQVAAGVYIVGYPTGLNADGYSWLWMLNTCDESATVTGFVAITVNVVKVEACP